MEHLKGLVNKANQIRSETESYCRINIVEKYITGFNLWLHCTPIPVRPIWETAMFESSTLAETSFFLAVHGFYEESCSLLRGIIDGFLTRLYWDDVEKSGNLKSWEHNGRSTNEYWEWESGNTKEYPEYKNDIKELLGGKSLIKKYDEKYCLWNDIEKLFRKLNKFVHGRPDSRHYDFATRSSSNITEFKKKHFEEWYEYLKTIYCIISVLSILQYPDLLGSNYIKEFKELDLEAYRRIKNILNLYNSANFNRKSSIL